MATPPFGYVYDERMLAHDCRYDDTMRECPERMILIHKRLQDDGLLKEAIKIEAREATDDELMLIHPREMIEELEALQTDQECEEYCRDKEILWLCPESTKAARVAAGSTIELVKANIEGRVGNSFAIVRPPGHHAFGKTPQGYCVFNNVAIGAKYATDCAGLKKVAVVDFDYHAGNGTYNSLKGDLRFHFTSFHAHHHGSFWPYSTEFDYDTEYVNILMFPLNGAMNTEADYMSAFYHLLIPMLRSWEPELILVSAGFDSGYYDLQREMGQGIKAHGYGHMIRLLNELCPNRVVTVLEGGYYPTNYIEAASMMVRGLQELRLPYLNLGKLSPAFKETMWNNIVHHSRRYPVLREWLEKLQENQNGTAEAGDQVVILPTKILLQRYANVRQTIQRLSKQKHGLSEYKPSPVIFFGKGMRDLYDEVKRTRVVRTREWFPDLTPEQKKSSDEAIAAYIKTYDYKTSTEHPSEQLLIEQMIWTERSAAEAFAHSAPVCLFFIQDFIGFLEGKRQSIMICDRKLMDVNRFNDTCAVLFQSV